jgi:hypothetical protein
MAHTFSLWCTFEALQTYRDDEVEEDAEGFAGDLMPWEELLVALEEKIRAAVSPYLRIVAMEIEVNEEAGGKQAGDRRAPPDDTGNPASRW